MIDFAATLPTGNSVTRNDSTINAASKRVVTEITKRRKRFSCESVFMGPEVVAALATCFFCNVILHFRQAAAQAKAGDNSSLTRLNCLLLAQRHTSSKNSIGLAPRRCR